MVEKENFIAYVLPSIGSNYFKNHCMHTLLPYELASLLLYRNLSLPIQMHACHRDTYKIKIKKCLRTVFFMVLTNDSGEQVHHKSTTDCCLQG